MYIFQLALQQISILLMLHLVASLFLLTVSAVLRLVHASVHRFTWGTGKLLIVVSLLFCLVAFLPDPFFISHSQLLIGSSLLGVISIYISIYSISQWTMRGWYLLLKKRPGSLLTRYVRNVLLFLRTYHYLFGWLVLVTATAHAAYFLPPYLRGQLPDTATARLVVGTGLLEWALLALLVTLGLATAYAIKHKHTLRKIRLFHLLTSLAFIACFLLHLYFID
jgi:hypothetical protein